MCPPLREFSGPGTQQVHRRCEGLKGGLDPGSVVRLGFQLFSPPQVAAKDLGTQGPTGTA